MNRMTAALAAATLVMGLIGIASSATAEQPERNDDNPAGSPDGGPTPRPVGELGEQALRDGFWHEGEFALWQGANYTGAIYDTSTATHSSYHNRYFVNTPTTLYKNASSTGNANRDHLVTAHELVNNSGGNITHLRYPQCSAPQPCYRYHALGWANNQLASHCAGS